MATSTKCVRQGTHAYPEELVRFILNLWGDPAAVSRVGVDSSCRFPPYDLLAEIVSTCYQASLMREEERPVRFRIIICPPDHFPKDAGPPTGLHRFIFTRPRPFSEYELYRLAPAAAFFRTLLGMTVTRRGAEFWGMVHSGTRWMQAVHGGRKTFPPLPPCPVIYVTGPGQISIGVGDDMLASLIGGHINCPTLDVFESDWLAESFSASHEEIWDLHRTARADSGTAWAVIDENFSRVMIQQIIRRIISVIRNSHHGGTLVYLPQELDREILGENRYMTVKYQFIDDEPRQRFKTIMLRILNTFAATMGDHREPEKVIGWQEYVTCQNEEISVLDEAIFDLAHFIAALSATDGAVVMTKHQELLGFGGVISGDIDKVETVAHALDREGYRTETELSEWVGTRHRAAYRLCEELHDAVAIVISQDGNVRVIKWQNGSVTYWDQVPTGVPGF